MLLRPAKPCNAFSSYLRVLNRLKKGRGTIGSLGLLTLLHWMIIFIPSTKIYFLLDGKTQILSRMRNTDPKTTRETNNFIEKGKTSTGFRVHPPNSSSQGHFISVTANSSAFCKAKADPQNTVKIIPNTAFLRRVDALNVWKTDIQYIQCQKQFNDVPYCSEWYDILSNFHVCISSKRIATIWATFLIVVILYPIALHTSFIWL